MKYKIGICDDDATQREYLGELVLAWAKKMRHLTELKQYAKAEDFLFDYSEEKDFDILLLDIEMPGISGIELARRVRRENGAVQIVFITGYYEYFSDGFDVSALHYLIKPVDGGKLNPVLDRAVGNLAGRQRCVLLATAEETVKVPLADITYAEAQNVYVHVHTLRESFRVRMTLGKFMEQLDETFLKVHRSYVVGLKYIKRVSRTGICLVNGERIPVSRGMYDAVHAALIKYL